MCSSCGYPRLFAASDRTGQGSACFVSGEDRDWINAKLTSLNNEIRAAVEAVRTANPSDAKARLEFVDVTEAFADHELCAKENSFLNNYSVAARKGKTDGGGEWWMAQNALHPNELGHKAFAAILRARIADIGDAPQVPVNDSSTAVDMVLAIDSTGSMGDNDPDDNRLRAANVYLTASVPGDRVGIVDFDDDAVVAAEMTGAAGRWFGIDRGDQQDRR